MDETHEKIISPKQWFDEVYDDEGGIARVQSDDKWNFIDVESGEYITNEWFRQAQNFKNGFAGVEIYDNDGKSYWNYIDKQGNHLSDEKYSMVFEFQQYNNCLFGRVYFSDLKRYNIIDGKGDYMMNILVDVAYGLHDGMIMVGKSIVVNSESHLRYNFLNVEKRKLISDEWFNKAEDFKDEYAIVGTWDGTERAIDKNGNFISLKNREL